jgi:cyclopropane-fatty-acyl-phospholipid synthase
MTSTFSAAHPLLHPTRATTWIERKGRALLFRNLRGLQRSSLTIIDPEVGAHTFGDAQADSARSAVIHVHDTRLYRRALLYGTIGAGEAYRDGWWTTDDLTAVVRAFVHNREVLLGLDGPWARPRRWLARLAHLFRKNTRSGSRRNIEAHYDLGNDFFALFLDRSMTYSSGVFDSPTTTLAEAQSAKYERLCRKLGLRPGQSVLEIGCGWGGFAIHAATHHGVHVRAVTISPSQFTLATERVREAGLADRIDVVLRDYRELSGTFDAIVSIEMIEAVGPQFYDAFFAACGRLLRPEGAVAMQAIVMPDQHYRRAVRTVDFIQQHVFPGSTIPSVSALSNAAGRASDLRLDQLEDITPHYVKTLHAWRDRLRAREEDAAHIGYDADFQRLWTFYLDYCAGGFAERAIGVVHLVFGKPQHTPSPITAPRGAVDQRPRAITSASL